MFRDNILKKLDKGNKKTIILAEGDKPRILKAARYLLENNICKLILVGDKEKILFELNGLEGFRALNPVEDAREDMIEKFYELRKHKGVSLSDAKEIVLDPIYYSTMLLKIGEGDGLVSGAVHSTADTVRPALQIIKTRIGVEKVSGCFFMSKDDKTYIFSDCAINPNPTSEELANIAHLSYEIAKVFDLEAKIAFLSYSTKGSAKHENVDKVVRAFEIFKEKWPDIDADGELQTDAALIPEVAFSKAPNSKVAGKANILIFPNLDSANISYKLVERLGGYRAIGPILLGLDKPMNDLSRGCSVDDIIDNVIVTCLQAKEF